MIVEVIVTVKRPYTGNAGNDQEATLWAGLLVEWVEWLIGLNR
jgi:hypothetical protein